MKINQPSFLLVAGTTLVFAILLLLFFKPVPEGVRDVIFTLVGTIIAKWGTMVDFNFGSSSGSAAKSLTLEKLTGGTGDGTTTTKATIETKTDIQSKETP